MTKAVRTEQLDALTFFGLLASKGQLPGAVSGEVYTPVAVTVEDAVREYTEDLNATGDFFQLMVENGQMRAADAPKKYNIKISRPTNLGGGFGGFGGFGGTATAH
jgi:hypothetical protein